jgi:hypothetical protein
VDLPWSTWAMMQKLRIWVVIGQESIPKNRTSGALRQLVLFFGSIISLFHLQ